jgi:hypothetical protein
LLEEVDVEPEETNEPEEMTKEQLEAIRARLSEPPPLIALAELHPGRTALVEYLARLQDDRIALVEEIDRLRAESADERGSPGEPQWPEGALRSGHQDAGADMPTTGSGSVGVDGGVRLEGKP